MDEDAAACHDGILNSWSRFHGAAASPEGTAPKGDCVGAGAGEDTVPKGDCIGGGAEEGGKTDDGEGPPKGGCAAAGGPATGGGEKAGTGVVKTPYELRSVEAWCLR